MPPMLGTNRFGERKANAAVLATTPAPDAEPSLMISMEIGSGPGDRLRRRDLGLGSRRREEGRLAHRKFWRQSIFWLSHKEDDSENQVKLTA